MCQLKTQILYLYFILMDMGRVRFSMLMCNFTRLDGNVVQSASARQLETALISAM